MKNNCFKGVLCLMSLPILAACTAHLVEGDEIGASEAELLGGIEATTQCTPFEVALLEQSAFVARVVLTSPAFEQCVTAGMNANYVQCNGDVPAANTQAQIANALYAARNVNDVEARCDGTANNNASASVGAFGNYGHDEMKFSAWLPGHEVNVLNDATDDSPTRFAPFPWPMSQVGNVLVHEALHQHGFIHPGTRAGCGNGAPSDYNFQADTVPYIVAACVQNVIERSELHCGTAGGVCSTRTSDDMSSCMSRGRLQLMPTWGPANDPSVGACEFYHDPGMHGIGVLQMEDGELQAQEMLPVGQPFSTFGWATNDTDVVAAAGNLNPFVPGDEFVVTSSYIGVISTSGSSFNTDTIHPNLTSFSHFGDGSGVWTYNAATNDVLGVGTFSKNSLTTREDILVTSNLAVGILVRYGSSLRTRNHHEWAWPMSARQSPGNVALGAGTHIRGIGDFNGDGQDDFIVWNHSLMGLVSRQVPGGELELIDHRYHWSWINGWLLQHAHEIEAVADFDGDGRDEILIRSNWGIALLGIPPGGSRLTSYWERANGSNLAGWTLNSSDQFGPSGRFWLSGLDSVVVGRGGNLGVLSFTAQGPLLATTYSGFSGAGWWNYGSHHTEILAGDLDGDGYDSLALMSSWGYAIVGRSSGSYTMATQAIMQTGCGGYDGCHDGLFGSWLARDNDEISLPIDDGSGADLLIMRSFE